MTLEFVAFDAQGREVDWIDPYLEHRIVDEVTFLVDNGYSEYAVVVPTGGRYEIRVKETP